MLFFEAIMHQFSSNVLNQVYNDALRTGFSQDNDRAYISGNFFLCINLVACTLQIVVMPQVLTNESMPYLLLLLPVTTLITSSGISILLSTRQEHPR